MKLPRVSGYVLAGGESSRMQVLGTAAVDKALLSFHGQTLLELALGKVRAVCGDAAILGGPAERCARLSRYGRVVRDRIEQAGPLAALQAALLDSDNDWVFLVPVDLPLLPQIALRELLDMPVYYEQPTVVCYEAEGREQPLPVLIHRSAMGEVERALENGERKLMPVLRRFAKESGGPYFLQLQRLRNHDWFMNVNTPEELRAAEAVI